AAFGPSADECRQHLDKLAAAIGTRDFTTAVISATSVRRSLELLHASIDAGGGGIDGPAQLNELEQHAKPLLDQAPVVSDEAYRERFYGRFGTPRPQWDAAEASWTGKKPERTPEAIAQTGTAGAGKPLPFLDRIQASFGRHDVSNVQAHTDEP